jgi:hypothetical protein
MTSKIVATERREARGILYKRHFNNTFVHVGEPVAEVIVIQKLSKTQSQLIRQMPQA